MINTYFQLVRDQKASSNGQIFLAGKNSFVPAFTCIGQASCCGETWSAPRPKRLRYELPETHPLWGHSPYPVPIEEYYRYISSLREELQLDNDIEIEAGALIGTIQAIKKGTNNLSLEWLSSKNMIACDNVFRDVVLNNNLTGCEFYRSNIFNTKGKSYDLYELQVSSQVDIQPISQFFKRNLECEVCGRYSYLRNEISASSSLSLESNEDFVLGRMPLHGEVFISQRAFDVFTHHRLTGFKMLNMEAVLSKFNKDIDWIKANIKPSENVL